MHFILLSNFFLGWNTNFWKFLFPKSHTLCVISLCRSYVFEAYPTSLMDSWRLEKDLNLCISFLIHTQKKYITPLLEYIPYCIMSGGDSTLKLDNFQQTSSDFLATNLKMLWKFVASMNVYFWMPLRIFTYYSVIFCGNIYLKQSRKIGETLCVIHWTVYGQLVLKHFQAILIFQSRILRTMFHKGKCNTELNNTLTY